MDYEKLFKKARAFGVRKGLGEDAEDFAQECLIKAYEIGPINLEWIYLNYRDFHRADKRVLSSAQGQLSAFRTVSLDAPIDSENDDSAKLGDFIGSFDRNLERVGHVSPIDALIERGNFRRAALVQGLVMEKTQDELANELNISSARVSQELRKLKNLMLIMTIAPVSSWGWIADVF